MKLHHPNIPGVIRERDDKDEIKAHTDAGWIKESDLKPSDKKEREAAAAETVDLTAETVVPATS